MNKFIKTLILTAVVLSPLTLISFITAAAAHHTPSHVSTISMETALNRHRKVKKTRHKFKKTMTTGSQIKKPVATGANTQPTRGTSTPDSNPVKPMKPNNSLPVSKIKPIDSMMGNTTIKPVSNINIPTPGANVPNIPASTPSSISNPTGNVPNINKPNLPTGLNGSMN